MAHVLLGAGTVQRIGVDQGGERRPVARAELARGLHRRRRDRIAALRFERRQKLLQLALGLLAARHAAAHVGLGARPYRLGIGLAEIAALAAIELGRRRHELALWFSVTGQRQALGHGERRIVPGLIFVRFVGFGCRGIRGGGLAVDAKIGGEKAVQPGALLARERRALRDQRRDGRHGVHAASAARTGARSASSRSAAISWRRQNSKNDLGRRLAMGEPGREQLLEQRRQIVERDRLGILARHRLLGGRGCAAADIDVIALDALLALLADRPCRRAGRYRRHSAGRRSDGSR